MTNLNEIHQLLLEVDEINDQKYIKKRKNKAALKKLKLKDNPYYEITRPYRDCFLTTIKLI